MLAVNQKQLAPHNEIAFTGIKSKAAKSAAIGGLLALDVMAAGLVASSVLAPKVATIASAKTVGVVKGAAYVKVLGHTLTANPLSIPLIGKTISATNVLAAKIGAITLGATQGLRTLSHFATNGFSLSKARAVVQSKDSANIVGHATVGLLSRAVNGISKGVSKLRGKA